MRSPPAELLIPLLGQRTKITATEGRRGWFGLTAQSSEVLSGRKVNEKEAGLNKHQKAQLLFLRAS